MPDPHVDGGNGKKAMVYNTNGEKKEGGRRKRERKRKREKSKDLSTLKS